MLVNQKVIVKWNKVNKKQFENKGYVFTNYGKEFELKISDLDKGSMALVAFICDYCNGTNQLEESTKTKPYRNLLKSRKNLDKDCCVHAQCKSAKMNEIHVNKLVKSNKTILDTHPELVKEWSNKNDKSPNQYGSGSPETILWECVKGHEWHANINNRIKRKSGCPYCAGVLTDYENSLLVTNPILCEEWNYKRNTLSPENVSQGSPRKVWWVCKEGHEWESTIYWRVKHDTCCPKCSSLGFLNPLLSKEWHHKNEMSPFDVSYGSGKSVWWLGGCGHEWEASVNSRNKGNGCPYCSGVKVCVDNCLATLKPDIAIEWNYEKNIGLTPYDVTRMSDKIVWWKCKKCFHEWKSTVGNRTYGNGCPQCKESKGEKAIRRIMEINKLNFLTQFEFNDLFGLGGKNLKFDFAVFNDMTLIAVIEYDGEFHYNKIYEDDGFETIKVHDKRKNQYCKENDIHLLRIPYWEFGNIEEILTKELTRYKLI